jgi:hypothetical protein
MYIWYLDWLMIDNLIGQGNQLGLNESW